MEALQYNEKLSKPNLTIFQKTVDRTAYSAHERKKILSTRDQLLQGLNPFVSGSLRVCDFYYPFILNTPEYYEVHYGIYPSGIILMPDDKPSYIRSVFDSLRRNFVDPKEILSKLELIYAQYPHALNSGTVSVINPLAVEPVNIANIQADMLPPSGLMVVRNRDPLQPRIEMGYNAEGKLFEISSYYNPNYDTAENVLSGIMTERYT